MIIEIDDIHLNDSMRQGMARLIERAKHAHMTDVELRINGTDERHEADWIKHMKILEGR